jgi:phosphate binding protein
MSHCPVAVLWVRLVVLAVLAGTSAGCQIRDAELLFESADLWQSSGSRALTGAEPADSSQPLCGRITIDGSSTVDVITQAVTEEFLKAHRQVRVTLGRAGTGGGFKRFDVDDLDICDASRPIEPEEIEACRQNGVHYLELKIALDELTVVVNPRNTWCRALTVAQLKQIWESGSAVTYWNQIDPAWPATKILLYGPDTDSGGRRFDTSCFRRRLPASSPGSSCPSPARSARRRRS